jgi:hypothetical protein
MEAIMAEPTEEGQAQKTAIEAVAQVLPSTKFLQNAGLKHQSQRGALHLLLVQESRT